MYLGGLIGDSELTVLKTTEIIYPNGSKTEGPIELPDSRDGHCMVEYAGIIISMGGEYANHYCQFWLIPEFLCFSDLSEFQVFRSEFCRWHWHQKFE